MTTHSTKVRPLAVLAAALALGIAAPAQAALFSQPPANVGQVLSDETPDRVHVAQGQDAAQLMVRIQELEEQLRLVNGQVEGLTFQITQMQTLLERMTEDNEFRFQALEGGASPKTEAATQAGGVTQPEVLPQDPAQTSPGLPEVAPATDIPEQGVKPLPGETEFDPTFDDGSTAPMDEIGNSGDPLVGTGASGGVDLTTGQPIDLSFTPGAPSGDADADAQFAAGYEAMQRGDYAFAEDQFSQFIELYPDNAQVADAANYLGDALLQRSAYDQAAEVLLNAFQKHSDSPRAPDLLLKLGMSLSGAGERETACRTFAEVDKRYTGLDPALVTRLAAERARAECPPA